MLIISLLNHFINFKKIQTFLENFGNQFNIFERQKQIQMKKVLFLILLSISVLSVEAYSQSVGDTVFYESGDKYIGEMQNGLANGFGKMFWADGAFYEGNWKNNYQNGKGKMVWATGETYEGNWVMGLQNGKGSMSWVNGDYYEGGFVDGLLEGKGTLWFANGIVQKGKWKANNFVP